MNLFLGCLQFASFRNELCFFLGWHTPNLISGSVGGEHRLMKPPENGVIVLWPNTLVVKCKYCVSQKRNEANNKNHWYNVLLTFRIKFTARS